jgi:cell division protease FtsH
MLRMNPNNKKPVGTPAPSQKKNSKQSRWLKNTVFYAIIVFVALMIFAALRSPANLNDVAFSDLVKQVNDGKIAKIVENGSDLTITKKGDDGKPEKTPSEKSRIPAAGLSDEQKNALLKVEYVSEEPDTTSDMLWNAATLIIPMILIIALFVWMMRQAGAQGNQSMAFGRSKAKLYGKDKKQTKFAEIAGNEEAKEDLVEVVDFLKNPKKFAEVGAKIPKGVLLVGSPGTGKTMMARAVAGEANVPFFSISGSEFVEMFVGVGASRVRDLFEKAKKNAPCIIFIDEIDAVGRRRGSGMGGGHDEREQTLNQILVEMDGFETGQNVIVLAATNRADVLDPALLRPGRFDRRVNINLPDRKDRLAILKVHFKDKPAEKDLDLDALAAKTTGSSGADLANIANEAAIRAARQNRKIISNEDITQAFEKVSIGPERKNKVMNEHDRELTAYHEGGHALVAQVLPDSDNVHKVTIVSRGATGGVTWTIPPEDRPYTSIVEFKDILARALGGRIAEEIVYGRDKITTGAGSDLRNATAVARDMIIEQGMGTRLRDQVFHEDEGGMMMDRIQREKPYSEKTAEEIDREVNELIEEAAKRARAVISENRQYLDKIKDILLEEETLDGEKVAEIFKGAKLPDGAKLY